jgi:NAD+ kinase
MTTQVVGLVPHPTKNIDSSLEIIGNWAAARGVRLLAVDAPTAPQRGGVELVDEHTFVGGVDAVIALGGDGTMLGAMRLTATRPVPVLGVNHGTLGFLVEVEPHTLETALDRLDAGDFQLEPHHALEVTLVLDDGTTRTLLAFNDLSLARRPGGGVVSADLEVDGTVFGYYRADGLVIATAAGSTAYNYSAGGPILSPGVAATVVTPVAPMSGINRAVVLGPDEALHLTIGAGTRSAAVELDGLVVADISEGSELTVRLLRDAATVIRLDSARYASRGLIKLSLLDLPLREGQLREFVPEELRSSAKAH